MSRRFHFCDLLYNAGAIDLPAIVADANAYAWRPEADAAARTVVPIPIATALDISLARRIVVGIVDNHAAAATGVIATAVLIADHADWLHEIRICVFGAGIDVRGICTADKQRAGARQQRNREFPHRFLLVRLNTALSLKACRSLSFPRFQRR